MSFLQRPQTPSKPKMEKCEIKITPLKDGGFKKSISGNCTKEQIEALSRDSEN